MKPINASKSMPDAARQKRRAILQLDVIKVAIGHELHDCRVQAIGTGLLEPVSSVP